MDTLASLQGPEIFWGAEGASNGYEESDIKGYDNFAKLCAAIASTGLQASLSSGDVTLLAPVDSAFEEYEAQGGGPITADILKYHLIPGSKTLDMLTADQPTLQGGTLKYERRLRKNWLDSAVIGLKGQGGGGSKPLSLSLIHISEPTRPY